MAYAIKPVDVFVCDTINKPGMLARILEALFGAGADLHFVIARRVTERTTRVFVAPLKGAKQFKAAADVGLVRADGMHAIQIAGPNQAGVGARITRAIAAAGINIRGLSAAAVGRNSLCYIAFATLEEARQAQKIVKRALAARRL